MYKNIIPELVSFDTKINKFNGPCFFQNMDYFHGIDKKNRFHYKIIIDKDIKIPPDYDFRNEYYTKKDNLWFYEKKIGFTKIRFKYDAINKIFYFNKAYSLVPFVIGGIIPIVKHIYDFIILDLFLSGFVLFRGLAFKYKNKNLCFTAPGCNGKTYFLLEAMRNGAKCITDDYLIVDISSFEVYPVATSVTPRLWSRPITKECNQYLNKMNIISTKQYIDTFFLVQNTMNNSYAPHKKNISDFLWITSSYFWDNLFIKSYLFEEGLLEKVLNNYLKINNAMNACEFKVVRNYDYKELIK